MDTAGTACQGMVGKPGIILGNCGMQMKGNPNQLSDAEQLGKDVAAAGFRDVELRCASGPSSAAGLDAQLSTCRKCGMPDRGCRLAPDWLAPDWLVPD